MFACIYRQSVSENDMGEGALSESLVDLAFTFSPLVEQTSVDTVVLDIEGCDLMFAAKPGFSEALGNEADAIRQRAAGFGFRVNVAIAANPDAAIHAARNISAVTMIQPGSELVHLGMLSVTTLDYSIAGIEVDRAEEIRETLTLWGVRTFAELARLPLKGIAQRLGPEGVRLQKLAQGKSERQLILVQLSPGFEQSIELEHPVDELEPLSFILSRLLNQLCANLNAQALATNELRLRLKLENRTEHERAITLPVPMRNPRTFLRLFLLDIESHPPPAPIVAVTIDAEPVRPRRLQTGLFIPLAPEPEKLELTLARLAKLVGADKVGSPELLDTHRPDAFQMKRFDLSRGRKKSTRNRQMAIGNRPCVIGFRKFRPPRRAKVHIMQGRPSQINVRDADHCAMRGTIVCASGPWRTSGDWWRKDSWARDEWDVAVVSLIGEQTEILCRIYRDLSDEEWYVEGVYD
jgi:protein ImuB